MGCMMAQGPPGDTGDPDEDSFPQDRRPRADMGPRVLAAFGWTVFLLVAIDHVGEGPLHELDEPLLGLVPHEGLLFSASVILTNLGYNVTLGAFALLGVFILLRWRRFVDAGVLAFGTAASAVIVQGLKVLFARLRPVIGDLPEACCSFPSGHASGSAVVFMMLAVLLFEHRTRVRPWAEGIAVGLALVIGASRVVLGLHWPTDVVAGLGLGWGLAGTFLLLRLYLQRRIPLPSAMGKPQPAASQAPMPEVQRVERAWCQIGCSRSSAPSGENS